MNRSELFYDERFDGQCIYCNGDDGTKDHTPSRIFLDKPYPKEHPTVACCAKCNQGFSKNEEYFACFIEAVICGGTSPEIIKREKIKKSLAHSPKLKTYIDSCKLETRPGQYSWKPDDKRIENVILKLARSHVFYEYAVFKGDEPESLSIKPLLAMTPRERDEFLMPAKSTLWPEIGSRAFIQAVAFAELGLPEVWTVVQHDRYQYQVTQDEAVNIKILISDYLACQVRWDCL